MNKVITLPNWVHMISLLGCDDNGRRSEWYVPTDLKDLNSDYINEHFGSLQDDAYRRGLEDGKQTAVGAAELREKLEYQKGFEKGKDVRIKGCEGCMYQDTTIGHNPCNLCCNAFLNRWTAKDDKIEVGDVVTINHIKNSDKHSFVVTRVSDQSVWGVDEDGGWNYWAINEVIKTDKHYDIDKILEEIKGDNDK